MTKIYCNNNIIETIFPKEIYLVYLKKIECKTKDKLTDVQLELIFAFAYKDFKKGNLALDGFSDISGYLLNQLDIVKKTSSRFGTVLEFASELNFYIRNIDNTIVWFMEEIDKYFEKDRPSLLKSLEKYEK